MWLSASALTTGVHSRDTDGDGWPDRVEIARTTREDDATDPGIVVPAGGLEVRTVHLRFFAGRRRDSVRIRGRVSAEDAGLLRSAEVTFCVAGVVREVELGGRGRARAGDTRLRIREDGRFSLSIRSAELAEDFVDEAIFEFSIRGEARRFSVDVFCAGHAYHAEPEVVARSRVVAPSPTTRWRTARPAGRPRPTWPR